jgi:acyl-CoA reductase-like NAD-dependent aldehyde dehydrogenase
MGVAAQLEPNTKQFVNAPVRKMLIDGKWVEAASGQDLRDAEPATGQVLARVAEGDAEDVDRAVRAARRAFDDGQWAAWRPTQREALLSHRRAHREARRRARAARDARQRKPFTESRHVDIPAAAGTFRYYAGWISKIYGETNPSDPAFFNFTLREPVGVCGQIIPWNFRSSCARGSSDRRSPAATRRS